MKRRLSVKLALVFAVFVLTVLNPAPSLLGLFVQAPKTAQQAGEERQTSPKKAYASTDVPSLSPALSNFGYNFSMSTVLNSTNRGSVVLVGTNGAGVTPFATSTSLDNALEQALAQIWLNNSATTDYAIYLPTAGSLSAATTSKVATDTATAAQIAASTAVMNFASLSGRAKSLTLVADPTDSLSTVGADTNAAKISLPSSVYLGTPTLLRNISLAGAMTLYAQANAFAELGGADFTGATSIYGGTDTGNMTGDSNLYFTTTGEGALSIYGGNQTSGTLTGSTHVSVMGTSGDNVTVYGGGNAGTVTGDSNVQFQTTATGTFNVYGGMASSGTVSGNANVDVTGTKGGTMNLSGTSPNGTVSGNVNLGLSGVSGGTTFGVLYGDAASTAPALSTSRTITMNVNTPTITYSKEIAATAYNLASSKGLLASSVLNLNIDGAPAISGGANGTDNFNNSTVGAGTNTAVLNLGQTGLTAYTASATLATNEIHNFTQLNIEPYNELDLSPSATYAGVIYNGGTATTTSNFQQNTSNF